MPDTKFARNCKAKQLTAKLKHNNKQFAKDNIVTMSSQKQLGEKAKEERERTRSMNAAAFSQLEPQVIASERRNIPRDW